MLTNAIKGGREVLIGEQSLRAKKPSLLKLGGWNFDKSITPSNTE